MEAPHIMQSSPKAIILVCTFLNYKLELFLCEDSVIILLCFLYNQYDGVPSMHFEGYNGLFSMNTNQVFLLSLHKLW